MWEEKQKNGRNANSNKKTTSVTTLNGNKQGPTTEQINTMAITRLIPGTTYYFKAKIYDVAGNMIETAVISAVTVKPTAEDVSYMPISFEWKVDNVKSALDYLYNR